LLHQHQPEVAVCVGIGWLQRQGLAQVRDGGITPAKLEGKCAQQVQGIRMGRIHRQDLEIEPLRLGQIALPVILQGLSKGLRDIKHGCHCQCFQVIPFRRHHTTSEQLSQRTVLLL
jgi:hypothetical protein